MNILHILFYSNYTYLLYDIMTLKIKRTIYEWYETTGKDNLIQIFAENNKHSITRKVWYYTVENST